MSDDKRRLVQRYVERQKAYLPLYNDNGLAGDPASPARKEDVGFGFETPVLRPRVPASTPDGERAARLADRRERKRKKRAIVSPPQKGDEPKKAKTKRPAALALLYGYSAPNVTKNRLTLKPAPSLGVFSKGKASTKKKVTTKRRSSKNELFSELAFLNKSNEPADRSKTGRDPDDVSSPPKMSRDVNPNRRGVPKASTRTTAESVVWDIEVQSNLPSSACEVSSEPDTNDASVVLDLQKTKWFGAVDVPEKRDERRKRARMSVLQSHSRADNSLLTECESDPRDEPRTCHADAADASSLYPFHSASQVGRAAGTRASGLWPVISNYFPEPKPVSVQKLIMDSPQMARSDGGIDVYEPAVDTEGSNQCLASKRSAREEPVSAAYPSTHDRVVQDAEVSMADHLASSFGSPTSVGLPVVAFQTRYDVAPLAFSSDVDDSYEVEDGPWEGDYHVLTAADDRFVGYDNTCQDEAWDWYPLGDDAEMDASYAPLTLEYENEPEMVDSVIEAESERERMTDFSIDGSMCDGEPSLYDAADFSEGRALLLGVPVCRSERAGRDVSGLVRAEMDVASRLRGHWRPLRF